MRQTPRGARSVNVQWKIAYADFATAMMAFFMLLWLISTSEKVSVQGLADYFTPSIATPAAGAAAEGDVALASGGPEAIALADSGRDRAREAALLRDLRSAFAADPNLAPLADNVVLESARDGIHIQITDTSMRPMFARGDAVPLAPAAQAFRAVAARVGQMPNRIAIEGHTAGEGDDWQLSAARAVSVRAILQQSGVSADRFAAVTGRAASEPLLPDAPLRAENRRITIILLNEPPALAPRAGRRTAQAMPSQTGNIAP
ncbi:flagellar motor protein MotB [Sphingosinicella soli]|uniref:Chemotaxis protein MotB n=1 Tax=Sphingosinicella soli TaxID=333708 RepID=A0A7W7F652_9SPHN|nr:flagellar motor protein MotB [Sphingosinicella soli]MBB4631192.1 chemotaxis protein MotB [Sphingosinicella soli]